MNAPALNPSDLYAAMLQVKANDGARGCIAIAKKDCRLAKIEWSFVQNAAAILGLQITKGGQHGYLISRAA